MTKAEVIHIVKKLVQEGNTEVALEQLLSFLEKHDTFRPFVQTTTLTQAKYSNLEREINSGTISKENADIQLNKVNRTILEIVDDLEQNRSQPSTIQQKTKTPIYWLIAGAALVMLGGLLTYFLINRETTTPPDPTPISECPDFEQQSKFDMLILPFQLLAGNPFYPSRAIKLRLADLSNKYQLLTDIEIFEDFFQQSNNNDLPDYQEATQLGNNCGAELIIWGTAEDLDTTKIVSTRYKFLNTEHLTLNKLKLEGENTVSNIKTVSSITTEGTLTKDIENTIMMLFGIVAHQAADYKATIEVLEQIMPNQSDTLLRSMTLADAYVATDQPEKAIKEYEYVLDKEPNNFLALNNSGTLYATMEDYDEAIERFDRALAVLPEDTEALTTRGILHFKLQHLANAQKDLERAKAKEPNDTNIAKQVEEVEIAIEEQKTIKEQATENIIAQRNVEDNLTRRADAFEKLGEHNQAINDALAVLKMDKTNEKAYRTIIQAYINQKRLDKAKEYIQLANQNGIPKTRLPQLPKEKSRKQ